MKTPTLEKILSQDAMETCENMTKTIARVLLEHDVPVEEQMLVMASIMATMQAVIDDCYNANPVSMKAAIDLLDMAIGRKVAVLGDMFELGEHENEMHGEVGAYAAQKGIDVIVCVGKLSSHMYEAAKQQS